MSGEPPAQHSQTLSLQAGDSSVWSCCSVPQLTPAPSACSMGKVGEWFSGSSRALTRGSAGLSVSSWSCSTEPRALQLPLLLQHPAECRAGQPCTLPLPNQLVLVLPLLPPLPQHIFPLEKKYIFTMCWGEKKYSAITHFYSAPFTAYRGAVHIKKWVA